MRAAWTPGRAANEVENESRYEMSTTTWNRGHGFWLPRTTKVDVLSAGLLTALMAAVVVGADEAASVLGGGSAPSGELLWAAVFVVLVFGARRVGFAARLLLRAWNSWQERVDGGFSGTARALTDRDVRLLYQVEIAKARGF